MGFAYEASVQPTSQPPGIEAQLASLKQMMAAFTNGQVQAETIELPANYTDALALVTAAEEHEKSLGAG